MDMEEVTGVRVDGKYMDPYEHLDVTVTDFDTAGFMKTKLLSVGEGHTLPMPADPAMHRLGTPVLRTTCVNFPIQIATYDENSPTRTGLRYSTIPVVSRDTVPSAHGSGPTRASPGDDSLHNFHHLYRHATVGTDSRLTINYYIYQLVARSGVTLDEDMGIDLCMAVSSTSCALQAIKHAVQPSAFSLPDATPLYKAWRYYARNWRRPHLELALQQLGEAELHIDELTAGLITRGAPVDTVRSVGTRIPCP